MPTITASDFRNGVTFEMDGQGDAGGGVPAREARQGRGLSCAPR